MKDFLKFIYTSSSDRVLLGAAFVVVASIITIALALFVWLYLIIEVLDAHPLAKIVTGFAPAVTAFAALGIYILLQAYRDDVASRAEAEGDE